MRTHADGGRLLDRARWRECSHPHEPPGILPARMPSVTVKTRKKKRIAKRTSEADAYRNRLRQLREALRHAEVDALLLSNPNDIRYLTGFRGEDSYAVVAPRSLVIISDFRFEEELAAIKSRARILIRQRPALEALRTLMDEIDVRRLGVQAEHMTLTMKRAITKAVGARRLAETTGILATLRAVKDELEIKHIKRAIRIQEQALEATLDQVAAGQTESEICALLEYEMKSLGAEKPAFDSIVAANANGSLPHAVPGAMRTRSGGPLLIDWGARVNGYCSDMTRTFALGKWPRKVREIYGIVLEAHEAGLDAVKPGAMGSEVDAAARDVISDAGYGPEFGHSLGHGIGLDVHEAPRLARTSSDQLEPGMIVTIEPGVYLPGVGGVRIEDDVLVTKTGARSLCSLPKEIDWATL